MSRMQRDKGIRGELQAVKELKRVFPQAARKIANDINREDGIDLVGTGRLRIQVKNCVKYTPVTTLDKIKQGSGIPVVVTYAFRREPRVVMRLSDLLDILADVGVAYDD